VPDHAQLLACLTEGVERLTTTDDWRRFLACQARFHHYSFRNVVLITAQRPDASYVAGFRHWRSMGRAVQRGERAIWILAPMVTRPAQADPEPRRVVRGFKYVAVFDVSQTEGDDLPAVCRPLTGGDPTGSFERLVAVARTLGFTVEDARLPGGTNGDCRHDVRRIRVEVDNAPAQRVKTLAHELAHAVLHERFGDRWVAELEAESTAYVVCRTLGLETGGYSFGYVATWAGGGEPAVAAIRSSGERIQATAARILRWAIADEEQPLTAVASAHRVATRVG